MLIMIVARRKCVIESRAGKVIEGVVVLIIIHCVVKAKLFTLIRQPCFIACAFLLLSIISTSTVRLQQ